MRCFLGELGDIEGPGVRLIGAAVWIVDLFRCESLSLKTHWVMVVMDQFTRRT